MPYRQYTEPRKEAEISDLRKLPVSVRVSPPLARRLPPAIRMQTARLDIIGSDAIMRRLPRMSARHLQTLAFSRVKSRLIHCLCS